MVFYCSLATTICYALWLLFFQNNPTSDIRDTPLITSLVTVSITQHVQTDELKLSEKTETNPLTDRGTEILAKDKTKTDTLLSSIKETSGDMRVPIETSPLV